MICKINTHYLKIIQLIFCIFCWKNLSLLPRYFISGYRNAAFVPGYRWYDLQLVAKWLRKFKLQYFRILMSFKCLLEPNWVFFSSKEIKSNTLLFTQMQSNSKVIPHVLPVWDIKMDMSWHKYSFKYIAVTITSSSTNRYFV